MNKYRTVYQDDADNRRVLTSVVNDDNTVTSSQHKFIIDESNPSRDRLFLWGVDPAHLWENTIADRYLPNEEDEIDISSAEVDGVTYERKASGYISELPGSQFRFNILIRHFLEGSHHTEGVDDRLVSRIIDNSQTVDDGTGNQVPEYDYFKQIIESGAIGFFSLKKAQITELDGEGVLDVI